jgi:hypothetical protein
MTTAICTECGSFRVGLFCPCPHCPGPPPKEAETGFYFSDLNTPEERLSEFSSVIKALASTAADSSERHLALWRYIQRYYPESAGWEMDVDAVERADRLLETVNADRIHRRAVIWSRMNIFLVLTSLTYCVLGLSHCFKGPPLK